jgi:hypothetical protein
MYRYSTVAVADAPEWARNVLKKINSKKRKVTITEMTPAPEHLLSYWDSGSRYYFKAWNAAGESIRLPVGGAPGFTPTPPKWNPNPGDILVRHGVFCGKTATPSITLYL